jgi:hypothetical protein
MKPRKYRDEHPLLQTVEEATALLRRCPVEAWFWWFAGTVPFVCYALHFWSDMSRAADADSHLVESAFLLAFAYGFMKVAHAIFGDHLLRILRNGEKPGPLPFRAKLRLAASQALIHCTSPWVLILSSAAVVPAGWAYAFYHNANILALPVFREGGRTRDLFKQAVAQCHYRPGQNHGVIAILFLFSILVWMNITMGASTVILLAKSFTGSENEYTRNPWLFLSSGFLAATIAASYMIAGPLVKACYAVRCFYGLSRRTGEDIAMRFRVAPRMAGALLILLASVVQADSSLSAADPPKPVVSRTVNPESLDKNIQKVLKEDAFQWRMPRDHRQERKEAGWFEAFVRQTGLWIRSVSDDVAAFFKGLVTDRLKEWLRKLFGSRKSGIEEGNGGTPWADMVEGVLYLLLAGLAVVLVVQFVRMWKKRLPVAAAAVGAASKIDLKSDQVVATQLAEDEWLKLAQEKIDAGDYRLALRALFLATLAHLGQRRMIAIAKSKSNGDYVRELALRARDRLELRRSFDEQSRVFDRSWYGWHDVTSDLLEQFRSNHQRIVADVAG